MSTVGRQNGRAYEATTAVRQVTARLEDTYQEHLHLTDLEGLPEHAYTPRMRTRTLAAQAVRMVTGFTPQRAAHTVVDGRGDQGIDAIAVVEEPDPHVYLIQSKWSDTGTAKADRPAVQELVAGLRILDDEDFAEFNPRARPLAEYAKSVLSSGVVPITAVYVFMRADDVGDGFRHAVKMAEKDFNRYGEILGHRVILAPEVWESVRRDQTPEPVELQATLFPWFETGSHPRSYQGVVTAEEIAGWLTGPGDLFSRNIRNPLGRTAINSALIDTLIAEPAHFWYYNNGITVLCESVEHNGPTTRQVHRSPLRLTLHNASVVNGAQTVRAVADAVKRDQAAAEAEIGVRIIVTGKDQDFAKGITQATNRQNRVEPRDFIALDPVQASIAEEIRAELGLEYRVRRSELEPEENTGCSVVEAAVALACLHRDSQYAARMAGTLDVLWERGGQGMYDVLFRPQPGAYLLWNSVEVLREVRRTLHRLRTRYEGRGSALTEHGVYLLAHLVFRRLDTESIAEPDPDLGWRAGALRDVPRLIEELVPVLAASIDALFGTRSHIRAVCADRARCRELVAEVLERLNAGGTDTTPDTYRRTRKQRKTRRPNAVSVIVDQGLLAEGTPLRLHTGYPAELAALRHWLAEDDARSRASWVNHRSKPLLWAADGKRYSPTGLISHMWEAADWKDRPVANQGTARWLTPEGTTLADLAWQTLAALDDSPEDEDGAAAT
ncbi:hypothetical protein SUDANB171_01463 [Streptomyces sp. enrichment culture]|uniref:AIPR family protein n=1 Tax=Streptomyces sp. enrichment culture TaxID=1795815 RepID=UPI003F569777